MTIRFTTGDSYLFDGLDLTVDLVDANQTFNVSVNNHTSGGTVTADLTSAKIKQIVNITASPDDGYMLSGISVTYDNNCSAQIDWGGPFYKFATFRMPPGHATITPTFTSNLTAEGGLYINMPVNNSYIIRIPEGVQSFKVYDDGGKFANYSNNCKGYLQFEAPEGCYLQLSGTIKTFPYDPAYNALDYLAVYENSAYANLIDAVGSSYVGEQVVVPTVESSGRNMILNFRSDNSGVDSGLDLTVTVKYAPVTITFAKEGYSIYYNSKQDAVLPVGMKAHIVTASENGTTLTYQTIADGDTWNKTVPAGTAVMLQTAASTTTQNIEVPLASPTAAAITQTNLLQGSDVAKTTTGDGKHYKLSYGASNGANANILGWYWGTTNGAAFTSGAHKAWLALPTSYATREFIGLPDGDNETPLLSPEGDDRGASPRGGLEGVIYDLSGRKINSQFSILNSQLPKGIYIKNGRKEVSK